MERQELAPGIFTISDVLSDDECRDLIALAAARGVTATPSNQVVLKEAELERRLWSRLEPNVPPMFSDWMARGLNECFRLYRCAPGERLSWRGDGTVAAADGVSLLTLIIYLNDGYEGGESQFESTSWMGRRRTALLFEHRDTPEGTEITSGVQYVLRSEVKYGPRVRETPEEAVNALTRRWQYYEEFYREGRRNEGMAAFVQRIAPLAIAENIHPRSVHAWLDLRKPNRPRWVLLLCDKRGSRFGIRWYKNWRPVMYTVKAMDSTRWQRILTWLDVQDDPEC